LAVEGRKRTKVAHGLSDPVDSTRENRRVLWVDLSAESSRFIGAQRLDRSAGSARRRAPKGRRGGGVEVTHQRCLPLVDKVIPLISLALDTRGVPCPWMGCGGSGGPPRDGGRGRRLGPAVRRRGTRRWAPGGPGARARPFRALPNQPLAVVMHSPTAHYEYLRRFVLYLI